MQDGLFRDVSGFNATSSSFYDLMQAVSPGTTSPRELSGQDASGLAPHGTTIVALTFPGGALLAGDRRATMGNLISHRAIRKVYPADGYSAVGIAGTAGIAIEMVRMFRMELEHYEKIEGTLMSLEGKANRLSHMVRGNLSLAMQGLSVVPLFAGFDLDSGEGRIFSYDVTGGRYEEDRHHSVGSGSLFARGALKKLYKNAASRDEAIAIAVEALFDAADDDSASGLPDTTRGIYPVVAVLEASGYSEVEDSVLESITASILDARRADHLGGGAR